MLKKMFFVLMSLLITGAFAETPVGGVPAEPCDAKPDVCCKEPAPGPFAFSFARELNLSCPKDFYFDAEFLLMQTEEEGLEYSITQKSSEGTAAFPLEEGDVQDFTTGSHKWGWNYGFRLIAGCYLNHDIWNLELDYSYLRIKHDHGLNATGKIQLPFWVGTPTAQYFNNASLRWVGNVNVIDLILGKPYHVSRMFSLKPYTGLRIGIIDQDFLFRYGLVSVAGSQSEIRAKNDFWGIGIRAGVNSEWHLDNNWSIFGNVAGAMLCSHFDVSESSANATGSSNNYELEHDFYTTLPNVDISLGLSFGQYFNDRKDHFDLKIAYEFHDWFKQNRLRQFTSAYPSYQRDMVGDLTYQGLAFAIRFDF